MASLVSDCLGDPVGTFLTAVGNNRDLERISRNYEQLSCFNSEEMKIFPLSKGTSVLVMAKTVSDINDRDRITHFFNGWITNHEDSSICLGQEGFNQIQNKFKIEQLHLKEGAFIHAMWGGDSFSLRHDCFGLYPILYLQMAKVFVASDSLLTLTNLKKMMGYTNKICKKVNATRSWTHGLSSAIMSTYTIVKGIRYLPPASKINVTIEQGKNDSLWYNVDVPNYKAVFPKNSQPYFRQIRDACQQVLRMVSTLQSIPNIELKLGLSGGLDSRVVLAALQSNDRSLNNVNIRSNEHLSRKSDYSIVQSMANQFQFTFNIEDNTKEIQVRTGCKPVGITKKYGHWALSNLGLFDMTYMYSSYWDNPAVIEMGGHGAEIVKGTFNKTDLFRIGFRKKPYKYLQLRREIKHALAAIGVPYSNKGSMGWHYLAYKCALQNASSRGRSLLTVRPLLNRKLCSMGLHHSNTSKNTILEDTLILLSPELAAFKFDKVEKNIEPAYIQKITKIFTGFEQLDRSPYHVFGTFKSMRNGTLDSFQNLADEFDKHDSNSKQSIRMEMQKIWSELRSKSIQMQYQEVYKLALERLGDEASYSASAGTPASKIISLWLTDDVF